MGLYDSAHRPKVQGGCIKFSNVYDKVGINWGEGPLHLDALKFYSDDNCKDQVGREALATDDRNKAGRTCVTVSKVRSVKGRGPFVV